MIDQDMMNQTRIGWMHSTMKLLRVVAEDRYTCNRPPGAAGAVIWHKGATYSTISYGFVEPPAGSPACKEVGCEIENGHCVRTIHAEQGAIFHAARQGIQTEGAEIFSILKPCYACSKAIIAAGIKKIYYAGAAYDEERTRKILENAGVEVEFVDIGLNYGQELNHGRE